VPRRAYARLAHTHVNIVGRALYLTEGSGMGARARQSVHLSNLFPRQSGTILSALNGAYDASSFVFYLFQARFPALA
jgi:hypothetical protein